MQSLRFNSCISSFISGLHLLLRGRSWRYQLALPPVMRFSGSAAATCRVLSAPSGRPRNTATSAADYSTPEGPSASRTRLTLRDVTYRLVWYDERPLNR